ncbi:DUF547 domain-containing protein [Congregibacter sp.]|uniref:DUF547 domain-containing protein n=1 Tax=Congregibacter sp. TaxID=2744308 RepID=UPI003F6C1598
MTKDQKHPKKAGQDFRLCWESRKKALLLGTLFLAFCSFQAVAQSPQLTQELAAPEKWTSLLEACVRAVKDGHSTAVDYDCFQSRQQELDQYLDELAAVSEETLLAQKQSTQLAFLINAYNAWTVKLILNNWPEVESIRDLGSILRSPWKKSFIPLLGDTVSLDDIEHGMIRQEGRFDDPRIHFAVNCASIGCPALRAEAYSGDTIDAQLEEQTQSFLADPSRNRFEDGGLEVSSIFKWYRGDFEKGWRGYNDLESFLGHYGNSLNLSAEQVSKLNAGEITIDFLDYDWRLNKAP